VIIPFGIACGIKRYGTSTPGLGGIGWVIILKNQSIGSKVNLQRVVVKVWPTSHDGFGAEGFRDTIKCWELVEEDYGSAYQLHNHQFGQLFERHAVYICPYALLDCADGTLNFADVHVMGGEVDDSWQIIVLDTFEFHVSMHVMYHETA